MRVVQRGLWKGGAMASARVPLDVTLREATQRKLRRFSKLRGTKGGTEICWAMKREGAFRGLSLPVCISPAVTDPGMMTNTPLEFLSPSFLYVMLVAFLTLFLVA